MTADPTVGEPRERRGRGWIPFAVAGAVGIVAVLIGLARGSDDDASEVTTTTEPAPVEVDASSIYEFASLAEMVDASDAVVRAHVVQTERGRLIGDPDEGGLISRVLTLQIDAVLHGTASGSLLVEEEGWLPDGTPLVVNGVQPTTAGEDGIFFLDSIEDPDFPGYLIINSQGRYLVGSDGMLEGGDQRDPLVQQLEAETADQLTAAITAIP